MQLLQLLGVEHGGKGERANATQVNNALRDPPWRNQFDHSQECTPQGKCRLIIRTDPRAQKELHCMVAEKVSHGAMQEADMVSQHSQLMGIAGEALENLSLRDELIYFGPDGRHDLGLGLRLSTMTGGGGTPSASQSQPSSFCPLNDAHSPSTLRSMLH